jgi:tetratricopeptide (TPR) repeat protein
MQPGNAENYLLRASFYGLTGRFDQILADCNEAIRLNPNLAMAYSARGNFYASRMDRVRARADFEQALRLNPGDTIARNSLSFLDRMEGLWMKE